MHAIWKFPEGDYSNQTSLWGRHGSFCFQKMHRLREISKLCRKLEVVALAMAQCPFLQPYKQSIASRKHIILKSLFRLMFIKFNYNLIFRAKKISIMKNLLLICFAFMCNFTAFNGTSSLQSSLNYEEGLGTASLAIIYGALIVSAMFLPTVGKSLTQWVKNV